MKAIFRSVVLGLLVVVVPTARADVVVPNAYATTAGPTEQVGILGDGFNTSATFQVGYSASQLGGLADGSLIDGIAFRLPVRTSDLNLDLAYSNYSIQIGQAARAIGSFSATFADNMGADTITARSGGLTIPAGSLIGGPWPGPNPFYEVHFQTPYVYHGGDLAITLRYTATEKIRVGVDAVTLAANPGVVDTVARFGSASATSGDLVHFLNAPIVKLVLTPSGAVPEPASLALMGLGLAVSAGFVAVRRRRSA